MAANLKPKAFPPIDLVAAFVRTFAAQCRRQTTESKRTNTGPTSTRGKQSVYGNGVGVATAARGHLHVWGIAALESKVVSDVGLGLSSGVGLGVVPDVGLAPSPVP